ncbi:hypothetical protein SK128_003149, partial [Halocaridina rubra]
WKLPTLKRRKRTFGKPWSQPSGNWFHPGVPKPPFASRFRQEYNSARPNNFGNGGAVNNWVHFLPQLFPDRYRTRTTMPTPRSMMPSVTTTTLSTPDFPGTIGRTTSSTTANPLTFSPEFPMTTGDGLQTSGYTFSDGTPLTLNPDAETLIPLL